jgi:Lrp/AsnC family leucine-responsive transcriptional regulator
MRLSKTERHILYTVLMNARVPVPDLARQVGCAQNAVQYALRKFKESGLIHRRVMIDVFRLGYARHAIYITLSSEGQIRREDIAAFLTASPYTTVVLDVGGDYDLFVATVTRSSAELARFNQELSGRFGSLFLKKDIAVTVRHSVFGEKVLVGDPSLYSECYYEVDPNMTERPIQVDDLDHRLLYAMSGPHMSSSRSLAQALGIPASTIDYRVKRLETAGVICGDLHEIRGEMIGLTNYIVLVGMKGLPDNRHREFYSFAKLHPNIAHLSFEVGYWDYMLGVAVQSQKELNSLVDAIRREFGEAIASVKSFSMFYARKVRDYPILPVATTLVPKVVGG